MYLPRIERIRSTSYVYIFNRIGVVVVDVFVINRMTSSKSSVCVCEAKISNYTK